MEDFLKMDVFFIVTTAVTVFIGTLFAIALVYAIRFLRTINRIGEDIKGETEALREDIADARKHVRGASFMKLFSMLMGVGKRSASRKKSKSTIKD